MLQTNVVAESTLELLKRLQAEIPLKDFNLAGGTALALYLGHRISVDLDLFSPNSFDTKKLKDFLEKKYGFRTSFSAENTLKGSIGNIKIDCIAHAYPYLRKPYCENGVRLYSMEDIIAMKLSAIADNGSRLKDFIDIAYLSKQYSFSSMLKFYADKFPDANVIRPLRAVTYFGDIDFQENVVMMQGKFDWKPIERRLLTMAAKQDMVFEKVPLKMETKEVRPKKKGIGLH